MRWNDETANVLHEFVDNTGLKFACLDLDVYCGIDMIAYRGTDQYSLIPVSKEGLDDNDISDHTPRKVIFDWNQAVIIDDLP